MEIWDDPSNTATIAELLHWLRRRQGLIPFVGAGLSVPFDYPDWKSFLRASADRARVTHDVEKALARSDYEGAAQRIEDAIGEPAFDRLIRQAFGRDIEPGAQLSAAVRLLPRLAPGPVITTNFDHVLETVFKEAGKTFELPLWGARAQLAFDALAEDYPVLLKLHGDALDPDRVFTRRQYALHYGAADNTGFDSGKPLPQLLLRLFLSRALLFLGCSLDGDRTIELLAASNKTGAQVPHFGVIPYPASPMIAQRAEFLRAHGIYPIWYAAGEHQLLGPFLKKLGDYAQGSSRRIGSMPGPVPSHFSKATARQRAASRRAVRALDRRRQRILTLWSTRDTPEKRRQYLRTNLRFLREDLPRNFLSIAAVVIKEQRWKDPSTAALASVALHWAAFHLGERLIANRALRDAERLLKRAGDITGMLDFLHTRAAAARRQHDYVKAEALTRRFQRLVRRHNVENEFAIRRGNGLRAVILFELNKRRAARRYLARAIWNARKHRHREDLSTNFMRASNFHFTEDRPKAMELAARLGLAWAMDEHLPLRAVLSDNLGIALYEMGRYPEALSAYRDALYFEEEGESDPSNVVTTLMNLATLELNAFSGRGKLGKPGSAQLRRAALLRAADYYEQALRLAIGASLKDSLHSIRYQYPLVLAELGETSRALSMIKKSIRALKDRGDTGNLAPAYNNRGLVWGEVAGNLHRELQAFGLALTYARKSGEAGIMRSVVSNYAAALRRAGRETQAVQLESTFGEGLKRTSPLPDCGRRRRS